MAVAAVNVFGLTPSQLARAEGLINPIHIIHMQDHIQIIIPEKEYESTIRAVHELIPT